MASRVTTSIVRRERIRNQIVLSILLMSLLAFVWFMLQAGESSGVASSDALVLAQSDDDAEAETEEAIEPVEIDVTYDVFLDRDPFESIRPEEPEESSTGGDNGTTGDTGSDGSGDGGSGDNGSGGDGSGDDGSGDGTAGNGGTTKDPVAGTTTITVLEVTTTGAVIRVGSDVYTPVVGDVFAQNLRLLRTIGDCVEIQQGDRVLPVLCAGEAVVK